MSGMLITGARDRLPGHQRGESIDWLFELLHSIIPWPLTTDQWLIPLIGTQEIKAESKYWQQLICCKFIPILVVKMLTLTPPACLLVHMPRDCAGLFSLIHSMMSSRYSPPPPSWWFTDRDRLWSREEPSTGHYLIALPRTLLTLVWCLMWLKLFSILGKNGKCPPAL